MDKNYNEFERSIICYLVYEKIKGNLDIKSHQLDKFKKESRDVKIRIIEGDVIITDELIEVSDELASDINDDNFYNNNQHLHPLIKLSDDEFYDLLK